MLICHNKKKWLAVNFKNSIKFNELMYKHTSFRVGGPAKVFIFPSTIDKLILLIKWIAKNNLPYFVIGGGTNILVSDKGIDGIIISLKKLHKKIRIDNIDGKNIILDVMAGCKTQYLCHFALKHGLEGLNFALGIPGTIGGALIMNAGTAKGAMDNIVESITVLLSDGSIKTIAKKDLNFSYRSLQFNENYSDPPIILSARFKLSQSIDIENLKNDAINIIKQRKVSQPIQSNNAGCFFKNPCLGRSAGELIDLVGLKGKKKGTAQVSSKHANFILNIASQGIGSATDILKLKEIIEEKVIQKFDVTLEPEVKIIGI